MNAKVCVKNFLAMIAVTFSTPSLVAAEVGGSTSQDASGNLKFSSASVVIADDKLKFADSVEIPVKQARLFSPRAIFSQWGDGEPAEHLAMRVEGKSVLIFTNRDEVRFGNAILDQKMGQFSFSQGSELTFIRNSTGKNLNPGGDSYSCRGGTVHQNGTDTGFTSVCVGVGENSSINIQCVGERMYLTVDSLFCP